MLTGINARGACSRGEGWNTERRAPSFEHRSNFSFGGSRRRITEDQSRLGEMNHEAVVCSSRQNTALTTAPPRTFEDCLHLWGIEARGRKIHLGLIKLQLTPARPSPLIHRLPPSCHTLSVLPTKAQFRDNPMEKNSNWMLISIAFAMLYLPLPVGKH